MKDWLTIVKQFLLWLSRPPTPHPPAPAASPERSKQEIFYDLMMRRLESQASRIDEVTSLAGNWLSGTGLLIAFPGLLLAAERNDLSNRALALVGGAGIVYLIGLGLVFISPFGKPWLDGPKWEDVAAVASDPVHTADEMYYSLGYAIASITLPSNRRKLRWQYILMTSGLFLVVIGVGMLLAVALWNLPAHHASDVTRVIATPTP